MKRYGIFIITILFLFINKVDALTGTVICTGGDTSPLNVRSDITGSPIGGLACNSTVEVTNQNAGSNSSCSTWYQVKYENKLGYACGDYIKLNEEPKVSKGKVSCVENDDPLTVRDKVAGAKIDALSCDTEMTILNQNAGNTNSCSNWYKVSYGNNKIGYVCGTYVTPVVDVDYNSGDIQKYRESLKAVGFPDSYLDSLVSLHTQYPNWQFIPYNTGLNWNTILDKEYDGYYKGWSLIEDTNGSIDGYKSFDSWSYNYFTNVFNNKFDGGGSNWYAASKSTIAYYMDPRNFLSEKNIFMFEVLSYNSSLHTSEGIEKMLAGTFMQNAYADKEETKTYADAFLDAAIKYKISPYVLVSRVIQEVGAKGSTIVSGTVEGYEGYYNFYNIGANASDGNSYNTIINGLKYAQNSGWDSPYKAIVGGAAFLGNNYVAVGQNTLYLQKWDLVGPNYVDHQYMQNIMAPVSESYKTYNGYTSMNLVSSNFAFSIPIFKNMPEVTTLPNKGNPNNYLSSLSINNQKLFSTPSNDTEFNIEVENNVTSLNITATKVYSGSSVSGLGTIALNEDSKLLTIVVTAQNGAIRTYKINVKRKPKPPEEPETSPIEEKVTVSSILAKTNIKTKDSYFYGFEVGTNIQNIIDKIKAVKDDKTNVIGIDKNGRSKLTGAITTGDKIRITTNSESKEYTIIIYGDVNGDGVITASDYVKIRNHIMDVKKLTSYEIESADVNHDNNISASDYVKIRNHIMEVSKITQ